MPLPTYDSGITLEEAINQFDYATSELVLHPFNGAGDNVDARRDHVVKAAQNSYITASRWYGVIEGNKRNGSDHLPDRKIAQSYISHVRECVNVLTKKVLPWYSELEEKEKRELKEIDPTIDQEAYNSKKERVKSIKREKDIIRSYLPLFGMMSTFVRDEFLGKSGDIDDGYRPPKKQPYLTRVWNNVTNKIRNYFRRKQ